MALQGINLPQSTFVNSQSVLSPKMFKRADEDKHELSYKHSNNSTMKASISSEYYSLQKYDLEYTSKDGDKISLSMEVFEYNKGEMDINVHGSNEDLKKLGTLVKDQLKKMSKEFVKNFLKDTGVNVNENDEVKDAEPIKVPEYWNAENTSQRIVDFAVSFFDAFKGSGDEFLNKIKNAIENGFEQAKKVFGGEFPDAASKLVNDTHNLVIDKLNKWAVEKNITNDNQAKNVDLAA